MASRGAVQYQGLRAAKKCTRCCRADAEPGFAACPPCRVATRERLARALARRQAEGKCLRCETLRAEGYSMCDRHVKLHRARMRLLYKPRDTPRSKAIQANRCTARLRGAKTGKAVDGRCRCWLMLPCHRCLPTIVEIAAGSGAGATMPEPP